MITLRVDVSDGASASVRRRIATAADARAVHAEMAMAVEAGLMTHLRGNTERGNSLGGASTGFWQKAASSVVGESSVTEATVSITAIGMRHPESNGVETNGDQGFGSLGPVLAFLVAECHLGVEEALGLRVDRAFALMALVRNNQGYRTVGPNYREREMEEREGTARRSILPRGTGRR